LASTRHIALLPQLLGLAESSIRLMVAIARQTERGYLLVEDIEEFPCSDLRTINQLWVKFSNGLFGFSVQKQIYVETGNPLDSQYHKGSWENFCDRVAWMINNSYVSHPEDVNFDASTPKGHLPLFVVCGGWFLGGVGLGLFSSLAQRLVKHNTQQS
jgi:hypothetical protein